MDANNELLQSIFTCYGKSFEWWKKLTVGDRMEVMKAYHAGQPLPYDKLSTHTSMPNTPFARFVARGLDDVVMGKNFHGLFEAETIYQVESILDTFVIRKIGKSSAATHNSYGGTMPDLMARSIEDLVIHGDYLLTTEEIEQRSKMLNTQKTQER